MLSKSVTVNIGRETTARIHMGLGEGTTKAMGWGERMELYEAGSAPECSAPFGAMPWMDGGDLHWGNTEFLISTSLRFGLDMQVDMVPRQIRCARYAGTFGTFGTFGKFGTFRCAGRKEGVRRPID